MTDMTEAKFRMKERLKQRHKSEKRFRRLGVSAIYASLGFLGLLFACIIFMGADSFRETKISLNVYLDPAAFGSSEPTKEQLRAADYNGLIKQALRTRFPDVTGRKDKKKLYALISSGASIDLQNWVTASPEYVGRTLNIRMQASDDVDQLIKGAVDRNAGDQVRRLNDKQMVWLEALEKDGAVSTRLNKTFFTQGDSREPELAGIAGAVVGSFLSILVCLALSFPIGVMAAVYLEEFAPKNKMTDFIEININNLAAVPSIVFGLLGLAIFLNVFELPRSSPLVGGMVLSLMTLPTIVIAGRAALKAVPPSIREAAFGLGASPVRAVFDQVLPLAMPGILTGTIIGTAGALGETAPLLMIGMVAFVVDIPTSILDPATALPVQVFLWADIPERGFGERTAAAIIVLLGFTCLMNLAAILLRKKFEIRW